MKTTASLLALFALTGCIEINSDLRLKMGEELTTNFKVTGTATTWSGGKVRESESAFCLGVNENFQDDVEITFEEASLTKKPLTIFPMNGKEVKKVLAGYGGPRDMIFSCIKSYEKIPYMKGLEGNIKVKLLSKRAGVIPMSAYYAFEADIGFYDVSTKNFELVVE